jgi:hypothetical protein
MLVVYGIVNTNAERWSAGPTLVMLSVAAALFTIFLMIERRVAEPLLPLSIFRLRSLTIANLVAVLWAGWCFTWFFIGALYLQRVLGLAPVEVGLAFLPATVIMAVFSLGLSSRVVVRFGVRRPLILGMSAAAAGLALLARVSVNGDLLGVLPGMILLGIAGGVALNPLFIAAMREVPQSQSGLASGLINTSFMIGGALGLSILASMGAARTTQALAAGAGTLDALVAGYRVAFASGAIFALTAAGLSALLRPHAERPAPAASEATVGPSTERPVGATREPKRHTKSAS